MRINNSRGKRKNKGLANDCVSPCPLQIIIDKDIIYASMVLNREIEERDIYISHTYIHATIYQKQ